jgi:hypothetical protein
MAVAVHQIVDEICRYSQAAAADTLSGRVSKYEAILWKGEDGKVN